MKLSSRARYALRMMTVLARIPEDEPVSLGRVAEISEISRRYLDQVVVGLKNASLLRSSSGRSGGYRLGRPADKITLRDIVEAAIGPINIVDCILFPDECGKSEGCDCRSVYCIINKRIVEALEAITLAEVAEGKVSLEGASACIPA